MTKKTYRAGLAGCGRMGATIDDEAIARNAPNLQSHLPYSHAASAVAYKRTDLVAVSDPLGEKAETIRARYNAGKAYEDYQEMIRREELDILCIATRPGPHAEIAVFAAESGIKGIYCEKPLCNSMRQADAMLGACERHGVKFNYGTQRRYIPLYRDARRLVEEGEIGDLQAILAHCGVGAAQWGHTHAADMLLFMAGDCAVDFVQGTALASEDDWEGERLKVDAPISMGYVHFDNDVHAYLVAGSGYEFELSGTMGKLRILNNGAGYHLRKVDEHGRFMDAPSPDFTLTSGTLKALEDLVGALDDDTDTQGNIRLACRSQEIILGMIASHRQGGARVELPLQNRDMAVAPDHY
jgi:predicted dehydrogenase